MTDRPSKEVVMMQFAVLLARRSTCARNQVGVVVTDYEMLQVVGIGYNGNARGLSNSCDSNLVGRCGCVHAEVNALLKAPGTLLRKILFTTCAPCASCAKAIINSNVGRVFYLEAYRDRTGLELLSLARITAHRLEVPQLSP